MFCKACFIDHYYTGNSVAAATAEKTNATKKFIKHAGG